ncbi:hypothetical protein KP509_18G045500 [Ceratopteris richardii]|uniref:RING-type E3 ubiquitin transferase n=1 Tax=Ceratopteris richardii TaxID=49495 RepID=A0A8T2SQT7_CERRI|nr:hypothetical protein KP509_18G045500 [Ceratopteris richardii]
MDGQSLSSSVSPSQLSNFCCNICEDVCRDPVVTFCAHIFCWPCLYVSALQHSSPTELEQPCPICKTNVRNKIVCMYGCGEAADPQFLAERFPGTQIPSRPSSSAPSARSAASSQDRGARIGLRTLQNVRLGSDRNGILVLGNSFAMFILRLLLSMMMPLLPRSARYLIGYNNSASSLRARRFTNEKEFVLHWGFICLGMLATVGFLLY